jgi:hypothetical protein
LHDDEKLVKETWRSQRWAAIGDGILDFDGVRTIDVVDSW